MGHIASVTICIAIINANVYGEFSILSQPFMHTKPRLNA